MNSRNDELSDTRLEMFEATSRELGEFSKQVDSVTVSKDVKSAQTKNMESVRAILNSSPRFT